MSEASCSINDANKSGFSHRVHVSLLVLHRVNDLKKMEQGFLNRPVIKITSCLHDNNYKSGRSMGANKEGNSSLVLLKYDDFV